MAGRKSSLRSCGRGRAEPRLRPVVARSISALLLAPLLVASSACGKPKSEKPADPPPEADTTEVTSIETIADVDGGASDGPWAFALSSPTPVFSLAEWPPKDPTKAAAERRTSVRLGYLRKGTRFRVKPALAKKANCPEGWFELMTGGFVCGKHATANVEHKELKSAPHPPYTDRPLPYDYGLNLTAGTPLYRRLPLKKERAEHEKTLAIGKGVKQSDVAKKLAQKGESVPTYLKDTGEKPKVGFSDLKGESQLVVERMLRGFYVALDTKVSGFSGTFWRTTLGLYAPKDHILVHEPKTEFEGVDLKNPGEGRKLPLAFVIGTRAREFFPTDERAKRGDEISRFTIAALTGQRKVVEDRVYWETTEDFWVRDIDVAIVRAPKPPPDLAPGEKWIDVDITAESLVAMEGETPVYATIVSTGRHGSEAGKDFTTVTGNFRIREKHVTDTMDDDASTDGTYRIEDVPWVMYFEKSYALHGAFWHSSFGRERSHGCVNLTPHDARRVFQWVGPTLPEGWHGVAAKPDNPGTRVLVHK